MSQDSDRYATAAVVVGPEKFDLGSSMSKSVRLKTFTVSWRRICAAVPAVALIGGGIALSAPPTHNITGVAVSSSSPAVVVPDTALSLPAPAGVSTDASRLAEVAPAPPLAGTVPSPSFAVPDSSAIPVRALEGYRRAAALTESADQACHIDWALVAAIGKVESNHARFGGNQLDNAGVAQPGIIGIALDGSNGTARITDTDGGLLDRDTVYDRAVGPMQFIPSTWSVAGVDGDGDGDKNPQNITDAATATAVYLCSGPGDLTRPDDLHAAIMRYNASESYVSLVTSIAAAYRLGVSALPAPDLAPASSPAPTSLFTVPAPDPTSSVSVKPVPGLVSPTTNGSGALAPGVTPTAPVDPLVPGPTGTVTTSPDPTVTVPPLPDPTIAVTTPPNPTVTTPPNPTVTVTTPDPTVTALPCVTMTGPTAPGPTSPGPTAPGPPTPCPTPTATTAP